MGARTPGFSPPPPARGIPWPRYLRLPASLAPSPRGSPRGPANVTLTLHLSPRLIAPSGEAPPNSSHLRPSPPGSCPTQAWRPRNIPLTSMAPPRKLAFKQFRDLGCAASKHGGPLCSCAHRPLPRTNMAALLSLFHIRTGTPLVPLTNMAVGDAAPSLVLLAPHKDGAHAAFLSHNKNAPHL